MNLKTASILIGFFGLTTFFSCTEKGEPTEAPPEVLAVYPSLDTLPENLLRMYILFSKPMKTVGNLEKIRLTDPAGNTVKDAIFNNAYELWDNEQKQLTILFDPARVKTGLQANEALGRALQRGKNYRLSIQGLEDVYHQKMSAPFVKNIYVVDEDTTAPSTDNWTIEVPMSNTKTALVVQFPQSLDRLSALQRIRLTNTDQQLVEGEVELKKNEKEWYFTPHNKWVKGSYHLFVNTRLEDPSGNNLNGLFDHKIGSLKSDQEGELKSIPINIH
ncbi:MAG: hypothetical protein AAF990_17830 [Bacteroidota bacterium]